MYHPTGRVLTVLELLQSRSQISGPELAERLETDVRTVRRYIGKLQDVGIPIESVPGRYGGYQLRPGYRLPPLMFSEDEAVSLIASLVGSPTLPLELPRGAVASSLSKIGRTLPRSTWERVRSLASLPVASGDVPPRPDSDTLLALTQASSQHRCVTLDYRTQETTRRTVEPYGLAGFQGHWYLVAYCRLRTAIRVFRLDRIVRWSVLDETFSAPEAFDAQNYLKEQAEERKTWTVRLAFTGAAEKMIAVLGDGDVETLGGQTVFAIRVADLDYVARTLMTSELSVAVLEPEELRQGLLKLADRARSMAESGGKSFR
jgi:predicted DNA-binding transcriptional regulator YafY